MPDAKIMATGCRLPDTNKINKFYGKYFSVKQHCLCNLFIIRQLQNGNLLTNSKSTQIYTISEYICAKMLYNSLTEKCLHSKH